ncbi:MAG: TonB-dependent receptor [Prevotellaceae bacterium]|jgi:TonB-dependent receptor|nr:TonB-dependent receptor [Prevotellaceae bacterium]
MGKRLCLAAIIFCAAIIYAKAQTGNIAGAVLDKTTGETIAGATVLMENTGKALISDLDGRFAFNGVPAGQYKLKISFISYQTADIDVKISAQETKQIQVEMSEATNALHEVSVVAVRKQDTELAMLTAMKASLNVVSGVSAQQIARTQDKDAGEVIKRVPGISIIDDKFVIARGLAQRYNNVWVNNSAVPSSEADARAFSFDIIPSSQIENIVIVKSPSPELPADFSGGFIKVTTKSIPSENSFQISCGGSFDTQTHFNDFKAATGSATDFIGFDNGFRALNSSMPKRLDNSDVAQVDFAAKNGFNNDWAIKTQKPMIDRRFAAALNRKWQTESGRQFGLTAALNYSYAARTFKNMDNARYGVYNSLIDRPVFIYKYTDNVYNTDVRTGAMLNFSAILNENHRLEFRNIFNQLGKDRYTQRSGFMYVSGEYIQELQEYLYSSRAAYSGQIAGNHIFSKNKTDWTLGFSYSNKHQPDRRRIERTENSFADDPHFGMMRIEAGDIKRDFVDLNELSYSFAGNYSRDFDFGKITPTLKAGVFGEYKKRDYQTRSFFYLWNAENLPSDFSYYNIINQILITENLSADKLYLYEDTDQSRYSYSGSNALAAGYAAVNLPFNKWNIYAGLRAEYNNMSVTNFTTINGDRARTRNYPQFDLFPSVNAAYNFDAKNIVRFACGASINRQEFRELSPSTYYDFDIFSFIKGNPQLKAAKILNLDLRYEFYPTPAELISIALFCKNFRNPIEWTYRNAGETYIYTFENAEVANSFGLEIDLKKQLDFIGLRNVFLTFNGALISSRVWFGEDSEEHDRPMQGQSPYLVNAGLFYKTDTEQWNAGVLYNITGRRIVGIGKTDASEGGSINNELPDMYEMPRHALDFTFGKKFGKKFEISGSIRDILAQEVVFKQFPKFYDSNNILQTREQTTKKYKTGRNVALTLKINL